MSAILVRHKDKDENVSNQVGLAVKIDARALLLLVSLCRYLVNLANNIATKVNV